METRAFEIAIKCMAEKIEMLEWEVKNAREKYEAVRLTKEEADEKNHKLEERNRELAESVVELQETVYKLTIGKEGETENA